MTKRILAVATSVTAVAALVLIPARAGTPVFASWVRVGGGATEPGIHIGPTGTIFVDGPEGFPGHSALWRSTDGGLTFDEVVFSTPWRRLPGGGDSDVAIRGERIYFLDLWVGSNSVSMSEDNGSTWVAGTPITSLPLSDRQWIALGRRDDAGNDTVYVLYALIQEPRQVMLARSRTSGLTWETHVPVPGVGAARGFTGTIVSDEEDFVGFIWEDGGIISAAYSADEGETWAYSVIASGVFRSNIPGSALDGKDMYAAWIDESDYSVKVGHSTDRGRTWADISTVSEAGTSNMFPWVAARDGKVAVAWYSAADVLADPNEVPAGTVWETRYAERLSGEHFFSDPVVVGPGKTGIICTQGLGCSSGRELGDFLSVTIDDAGMSVVAFGGRVAGAVKIAQQIG